MVRWNLQDLFDASTPRRSPVPVFACWPDVAPTLIHIARGEDEARAYIDGYNRAAGDDDGEAATLQDIIADPESHGLGQAIGGFET